MLLQQSLGRSVAPSHPECAFGCVRVSLGDENPGCAISAPASGDRSKDLRLGLAKHRLLLGLQLQIRGAAGPVCARGEYLSRHAQIGMAHMGALGGLREGEGELEECSRRHFVRVLKPPALSHSSGLMTFTVWPKVQMCPSGSRAR